jgi:hypothetical protein
MGRITSAPLSILDNGFLGAMDTLVNLENKIQAGITGILGFPS